ncbi:DUF2631 domain-containing protein [Corynebacterium caspium]|uniref:DUF2631 domain-containing protein n=1 Tax=Corynebacterium caspium TaxID=234828 RepID=UPI00035E1501|nr:DUF2631 domain-containing protein [Corynebacterium caspium]WKD59073.1 hypothetical protein CCASP_03345 [Corynebacterium caspium DSM 44850]
MAASHSAPPEIYNGVSTLDEPSAKWGWHGTPFRSIQVLGWSSFALLLLYNFGNHEGHVETVFLLIFAAVIALGLILHMIQPKMHARRTLTAHNKPAGHQEPDWAYLQATVQGPYAELSDSQLRALNIKPSRVAHLRVDTSSTAKHALN